jgi:3-dehydroquinate synthase
VKHAVIADADYFDFLEKNIEGILERQLDLLEQIAGYNCRIKASVVEADPAEKNQRRMLNYGHTIGHAVEAASGYQLLHGEAVAIGIIAAGLIEIELDLGGPEKLGRIRKMLEKIGMPVTLGPNLAEKNLIELVRHDKKAVAAWPRFVLTSQIGCVHCPDGQYAVPVEQEIVEKVLTNLK